MVPNLQAATPQIAAHPQSTVAFSFVGGNRLCVAFEGERDFLSAPRPFFIVELCVPAEPLVATGGQYLSDELWEELHQLPFGGYRGDTLSVEGEEDTAEGVKQQGAKQQGAKQQPNESKTSDGEGYYVFYSPNLILECFCKKCIVKDTLYHHRDAGAALIAYLSSE